jgi:type I restriction enzyme R subunit
MGSRQRIRRSQPAQPCEASPDQPLGEEVAAIRSEVADGLHAEVAAMNVDNFLVRPHRRQVERFSERQAWDELSPADAGEAGKHLAGLPTELDPEDITARQFDLLLLNLQLAYLRAEPQLPRLQNQVMEIAALLEEKGTIPLVAAQMELILEIQTEEFWTGVTLPQLERVRKRLRDLVKFIERGQRKVIYTHFEDEMGPAAEAAIPYLASSINVAQYRKKVMQFLEAHRDHRAVVNLRLNKPLSPEDLAALEDLLYNLGGEGSREQFEASYGQPASLAAFIRGLVGLDRQTAQGAFARFLQAGRYNANQIRFVNQIAEYLTQNGVMDPGRLYEQPFTDYSPSGIDGLFPDPDAQEIVNVLALINRNAGWEAPGARA